MPPLQNKMHVSTSVTILDVLCSVANVINKTHRTEKKRAQTRLHPLASICYEQVSGTCMFTSNLCANTPYFQV